jgi:hypothetical protein
MGRQLKVGHVGTGQTGGMVLRQILRSRHLKLTGHLVYSPEKVGRDSGEIVGAAPVGVSATDSLAEFLALDAHCVTYVPSASGRDPDEVVTQICAILATGKNVITADTRMTFPPALDEASRAKLRSACDEGDSTFLATGIAPGFATDVLPVHLASLTEQPKSIRVEERLPSGTYRAPSFFALMASGARPRKTPRRTNPAP